MFQKTSIALNAGPNLQKEIRHISTANAFNVGTIAIEKRLVNRIKEKKNFHGSDLKRHRIDIRHKVKISGGPNEMGEDDIRSIYTILNDLKCNTANLIGRFDSHIQNNAIHSLPPCEHHKALAAKLWAVGLAAFTGLASAVYAVIK
jgi:hypothetical protein